MSNQESKSKSIDSEQRSGKGFSGEMNELEEINKIHGTNFKIGDTIKQERSPKRPHIGMLAATEDGHLKMIHDGDSSIYPALYNPSWVEKISA